VLPQTPPEHLETIAATGWKGFPCPYIPDLGGLGELGKLQSDW